MGFSFFGQRTLRGFVVGEVVSALQKAVRRSQEREAVVWAVELDQSGHGNYLWNRLEIICSEDVGVAWLEGPAVIAALKDSYDRAVARRNGNRPERLFVVHAAMLLARAPKSRRVDEALWAVYGQQEPWFDIPDEALDIHTARGRKMGRTPTSQQGLDHWFNEASRLVGEAPDCDTGPYHERFMSSTEEAFNLQTSTRSARQPKSVRAAADTPSMFDPKGD